MRDPVPELSAFEVWSLEFRVWGLGVGDEGEVYCLGVGDEGGGVRV